MYNSKKCSNLSQITRGRGRRVSECWCALEMLGYWMEAPWDPFYSPKGPRSRCSFLVKTVMILHFVGALDQSSAHRTESCSPPVLGSDWPVSKPGEHRTSPVHHQTVWWCQVAVGESGLVHRTEHNSQSGDLWRKIMRAHCSSGWHRLSLVRHRVGLVPFRPDEPKSSKFFWLFLRCSLWHRHS
jgi:hypothetical protein